MRRRDTPMPQRASGIARAELESIAKRIRNEKAGPLDADRPHSFPGSGRSLRCCGLLVLLHAAALRLGLGHHLALDAQRRGKDRGDAGGVARILDLFTTRATTAARLLGARRLIILVRRDGRRNLGGIALGLALAALIAVVALATAFALVAAPVTLVALVAVTTFEAVAALAASTLLAFVALLAFARAGTLGAVVIILVVAVEIVAIAALAILLLEARPALRKHAEIVIGELEVIFGVDAVTGHLGVARKVLVFLKKLRGVATGAVVDAVAIALVGIATTLLALTTTAATATVVRLTIVHQRLFVLSLTQSAIDHQ